MSQMTSVSLDFAEKFAAKLATALELPVAIAAGPNADGNASWSVLRVLGLPAPSAKSLLAGLENLEFRWSELGDRDFIKTTCSKTAILAIDASEHRDRSLGMFVSAPDVPDALIETLMEALRVQVESEQVGLESDVVVSDEPQIENTESFIEQITQDFEELTWLRQSHQFADLYSVNATSDEVARTCVASLSPVIQAETLCYLEIGKRDQAHVDIRARLHILAGPSLACSATQMHQWIHQWVEQGRTSPIVVDRCHDGSLEKDFPFFRNCMVTVVAKGDRVYGWLVAANKIESDDVRLEPRLARGSEMTLERTRFGTFEAGLMTTAANILASQASNAELFAAQEELTKGLVLAIINAIDAKDCYTAGHSERVASFAQCIASRMGLPKKECDRIHMAGLLHDVGKIGIPDSVLKKPGKLTDEEFDVIKQHPSIGHSILGHLTNIEYVLPGVLLHHEAFDGSGYPEGRKGEEIPSMARILAVSDAFDAMTSTRPYRTALPLEKAKSILQAEANKTWDSKIVQALLDCIDAGTITPGKVATVQGPGPLALAGRST